jgi:hypothetical protein
VPDQASAQGDLSPGALKEFSQQVVWAQRDRCARAGADPILFQETALMSRPEVVFAVSTSTRRAPFASPNCRNFIHCPRSRDGPGRANFGSYRAYDGEHHTVARAPVA